MTDKDTLSYNETCLEGLGRGWGKWRRGKGGGGWMELQTWLMNADLRPLMPRRMMHHTNHKPHVGHLKCQGAGRQPRPDVIHGNAALLRKMRERPEERSFGHTIKEGEKRKREK